MLIGNVRYLLPFVICLVLVREYFFVFVFLILVLSKLHNLVSMFLHILQISSHKTFSLL